MKSVPLHRSKKNQSQVTHSAAVSKILIKNDRFVEGVVADEHVELNSESVKDPSVPIDESSSATVVSEKVSVVNSIGVETGDTDGAGGPSSGLAQVSEKSDDELRVGVDPVEAENNMLSLGQRLSSLTLPRK